MHKLKQRLRSLPLIAPFIQWLWDLFTLSRFKRDHHLLIVKLEQENSGLHEHCFALQNRIDILEQNHVTLRDRTDILEQIHSILEQNFVALRDRTDMLEHNHALLKESLEPTVEKLVAQQIYYQSLALQQRIDQLGFDARIVCEPVAT